LGAKKILSPTSLQAANVDQITALQSGASTFGIIPSYSLAVLKEPGQTKQAGKFKIGLVPASHPGGVSRALRAPVWLLHPGHPHDRLRPAPALAEPQPGRAPARARREHLSLHGLSRHRRRGGGGGLAAGWVDGRGLRPAVALALMLTVLPAAPPAESAPEGQMTWAVHVSLAPTWFDPAETPALLTPFMVLYALHDAVVKPLPGNALAPSLAESWNASRDGVLHESEPR